MLLFQAYFPYGMSQGPLPVCRAAEGLRESSDSKQLSCFHSALEPLAQTHSREEKSFIVESVKLPSNGTYQGDVTSFST